MAYELVPIICAPGTDKDNTALSTDHFVDATAIRFYNGFPEKIGGNVEVNFGGGNTISGLARTIYTSILGTDVWTLVGTNTRLYGIFADSLTNITPLVTGTTAIANSLSTTYTTLGTDPLSTISGSATITVTHTAHNLFPGDTITLSGASSVNGISSTLINTTHLVRSTTANTYTITVGASATSSGSGGGSSVVEATGIITVTQSSHGYLNGDRVGILSATSVGGISSTIINAEQIIRNVKTNTYDFMTSGTATSSVSAGGGSGTTVQGQIPAGAANEQLGIGYGMGLYGVGLYGEPKESSNIQIFPRIWSFDNFGNNPIMTPGGQTGIYQWLGDIATAPQLLQNAPTAVNYIFVSNEIIVALGSGGVPNKIQWSDQGNSTVWSPSLLNQARSDVIEGAGQFISQINIRGINLLFTNASQVYTMIYVGSPFVFQIKLLDNICGLIAQNARCSFAGIAYWMGNSNFYMSDGSSVSPIPSNSRTGVNYVRKFVFANLNQTQSSKCFAWVNPLLSEIQFHFPSSESNECDMVARYNIVEQHWTIDSSSIANRTAALCSEIDTIYPFMIDQNGTAYYHEFGTDDNGAPLEFSLTTKQYVGKTRCIEIEGILPDSIQDGAISINLLTYPYTNQSPVTVTTNIPENPGKISIGGTGRTWQYSISQSVRGGNWRSGVWYQYMQEGVYEMPESM